MEKESEYNGTEFEYQFEMPISVSKVASLTYSLKEGPERAAQRFVQNNNLRPETVDVFSEFLYKHVPELRASTSREEPTQLDAATRKSQIGKINAILQNKINLIKCNVDNHGTAIKKRRLCMDKSSNISLERIIANIMPEKTKSVGPISGRPIAIRPMPGRPIPGRPIVGRPIPGRPIPGRVMPLLKMKPSSRITHLIFYKFHQSPNKKSILQIRETNKNVRQECKLTEWQLEALGDPDIGTELIDLEEELLDAFDKCLRWPSDMLYPVLDILRVAMLSSEINETFCEEEQFQQLLEKTMSHLASQEKEDGVKVMIARMICNIASHASGRILLSRHCECLMKLLSPLIGHDRAIVRMSGAVAASNIANVIISELIQYDSSITIWRLLI